jgi:hypothetical protein
VPAIGELANALTEQCAVHVGVSPASAQRLLVAARGKGFDCHVLDMSTVIAPEDYYALLEREFAFPTPVVEFHGAMDWMSDLEWLGAFPGHLVVVDGLAHLLLRHQNTFRELVYMFPSVIDRMRSGGEVYHAILVGRSDDVIDAAMAELNDANAFLSEPEVVNSVNPSQPATIIRHDQPG